MLTIMIITMTLIIFITIIIIIIIIIIIMIIIINCSSIITAIIIIIVSISLSYCTTVSLSNLIFCAGQSRGSFCLCFSDASKSKLKQTNSDSADSDRSFLLDTSNMKQASYTIAIRRIPGSRNAATSQGLGGSHPSAMGIGSGRTIHNSRFRLRKPGVLV